MHHRIVPEATIAPPSWQLRKTPCSSLAIASVGILLALNLGNAIGMGEKPKTLGRTIKQKQPITGSSGAIFHAFDLARRPLLH